MGREIKFRAIAASGVMVYGDLITQGYYAEPKFGLIGCGIQLKSGYTERIPDCSTVGQFTGVADKNGKEIFEGDICKVFISTGSVSEKISGSMFGIVKYGNCFTIESFKYTGELTRMFGKNTIYGYLKHSINGKENIEVIGNIHENPELV